MALNYVFDAPALNTGRYLALQDFNFATLADAPIGKGFPGMTFPFMGAIYQIVQNRSAGALAQGDVVSLFVGDATRSALALTSASTAAILVTTQTFQAGLAGVWDYPGLVSIVPGAWTSTANAERHPLYKNSTAAGASTLTIAQYERHLGPNYGAAISSPDALSTTPTSAYTASVSCPWEITKADSGAQATKAIQGVIVSSTLSQNNFGVACIYGLAVAKCDGTVALVAGDPIRSGTGGTAGIFVKHTYTGGGATGPEALNGDYIAGMVLDVFSVAGTGQRPVFLNGRWALMPFPITT